MEGIEDSAHSVNTRSVWALSECTLRYLPATAFDPANPDALRLSDTEIATIRGMLRRHANKRKVRADTFSR